MAKGGHSYRLASSGASTEEKEKRKVSPLCHLKQDFNFWNSDELKKSAGCWQRHD
jgi:hypothetical protein